MASGKSVFEAVVGRLLFREVTTLEIRDLGRSFRLVGFGGDALRSASWEAGDKIQIYLPGQGMRTYTPMTWDADRGTAELLVYIHGTSPGAEWGRRLRVGDRWQLFGPRRSIRSTGPADPLVLFGDETSFGVARALADAKRGSSVRCVFEVNDAVESKAALAELGVSGTTIERRPADAHLAATSERLLEELDALPSAALVMTGRAQSIQLVRGRLKAKRALRAGKVKAYWSVGKTGLD
ncbi:MAG: siderophore-interacting protein [Labilithrix sp.]|nr:siderophore-interacting protein [Labilithrix sp.]MCW5834769.1 siderophore-interacting protein [Labilithrix sp.]